MMNEIEGLKFFIEELRNFAQDRETIESLTAYYEELDQIWTVPDKLEEIKALCAEIKETLTELNIQHSKKDFLEGIDSINQELSKNLIKLEEFCGSYRSLLKKYGSPESLMAELEKDRANDLELFQDKICDFLESDLDKNLKEIRRKLDKFVRKSSTFKGRKIYQFTHSINNGIKKLNSCIELITKLTGFLYELNNSINVISSQSSEKISRDYYFVFSQLNGEMAKGLWANKFVELLTGLQSVTGSPSSGTVLFEFEEEDPEIEPSTLTLNELFFRYPPFEPIAQKKKIPFPDKYRSVTIPISGSFVWFVRGNNTSFSFKPVTPVIRGKSKQKGMYQDLKEVRPFNILSLKEGEFQVTVWGERFPIWVKYGSRKLVDSTKALLKTGVDPHEMEKILQRKYEHFIGRSGKAYKCTDLSYVWYCRRGLAMSTDPWDSNCPFDCRSRYEKSGKCVFWSYSRRIFPKVFAILNRKIFGLDNLTQEEYSGFLNPITGRGVRVQEVYEGVHWHMPQDFGSGMPVYVEFEKGLLNSLPKTNVIGFAIPYSFLKTIFLELLDPETTPKPQFSIDNETSIPLDKLLLSKYFIWLNTSKGRNTYRFLGNKKDKLVKMYKKFLKDTSKDIGVRENIVKFAIDVLSHTLSHLLLFFISKELEIEYKDLIYIYTIDEEEDKVFITVAENSPLGVIGLVDHVEKKFGNTVNMINEFIKEIITLFNEHESELKSYQNEILKAKERYFKTPLGTELKEIGEMLEEYYNEFLQNGILMDLHNFPLHIHLTDLVPALSKKAGIEPIKVLTELGNLLQFIGPSYCIDGCNSCVMFEAGCTKPISQNLELSRNITAWFLKIISGEETIVAKGGRLGKILLKKIPKRSVFVVSPYLDEAGVDLLTDLSKNGIEVTLVTRRGTFEEFKNKLKNVNDVYFFNFPRHEKMYIIDDRILIDTTWNLTPSKLSTNRFKMKLLEKAESMSMRNQIIENSMGDDDV